MNIDVNSQKSFLNRYQISLNDQVRIAKIDNYEDIKNRFMVMENPEKQKEAAHCIPETALVVILIGIGNGIFIRNIRKGLAERVRLIIWEPEWEAFLYACQNDLSDIFLCENVDIIVGSDKKAEENLEEILKKRLDYYNLYHSVIFTMPGFGDIYQAMGVRVTEIFNRATFDLRIDVGTREASAQRNCLNELYAMSIMHNNYLIDRLWEAIPTREIPVIIVASGPSLKKNVSLLKGLESRALILSAAHSVKVLKEYGAPMHFAAMMDAGGAHFMDSDTEGDTWMLMGTTANRSLQEKYNGKMVYFSFDQYLYPLSGINANNYGYGLGGSIATALLSMVRCAGFRTVILLGQDLAYDDNGYSHASGEKEEQEDDYWLEGINGGKVRARSDWVLFKKSFETEIKEHPDLKVIDATEGGALIQGSIVMTLNEAIKGYCEKEYPIQEWIESIPKNGEKCKDEVKQIIRGHFREMRQTEIRLEQITQIGRYLLEQCENYSLAAEKNESYCKQYDRLYAEIIDEESDELTMKYSDDIVQQYVIQAMSLEGDAIVDKRMKLELDLFEGMLIRNRDLIAYVQELFPGAEMG